MRAFILTALAAMTIAAPAYAGPVHVFGPGGPAPALKEAAATFPKLRGVKVEVVAGPTSDWIDAAKQSGDVIYSGSETMMTDLQLEMGDRIDPTTVTPSICGYRIFSSARAIRIKSADLTTSSVQATGCLS